MAKNGMSKSLDERFDEVMHAVVEQRQYTEFAFGRLEERMTAGFARMETRLGGVETRIGGVETRLSGVETRLNGVETRLERLEHKLDQLIARPRRRR